MQRFNLHQWRESRGTRLNAHIMLGDSQGPVCVESGARVAHFPSNEESTGQSNVRNDIRHVLYVCHVVRTTRRGMYMYRSLLFPLFRSQQAFICNHDSHWLTVRKLGHQVKSDVHGHVLQCIIHVHSTLAKAEVGRKERLTQTNNTHNAHD